MARRLNPKRRKLKAAKRRRQLARRKNAKVVKAAKPEPKIGTPAFAKLQALWYQKLVNQGFEDIEWTDVKSGRGQDGPHLRGSFRASDAFRAEKTALYFRLWENWYTFNQHKIPLKKDRFIIESFKDGRSYRWISQQLIIRAYYVRSSLFSVFTRLKHFKQQVIEFNKTSPDGLLYEGDVSESAYQVKGLV